MSAQAPVFPAQETDTQSADISDAFTDTADRMDWQHSGRLPGFPEAPVATVVPDAGEQTPTAESGAVHPSAADRFFESDITMDEIDFGPGWLSKAKERFNNMKLRTRMAVGAVAMVGLMIAPAGLSKALLPSDAEREAHPDPTDEPVPLAEEAVPDSERVLGGGYAEAMREHAENIDFTVEAGARSLEWDVFRMEASQTPLEKTRAALHNVLIPGQINVADPRLADVMGPDASATSHALRADYGDTLQINPIGEPTETRTEHGTVIRVPVRLQTSSELPIQGLRASGTEDRGDYVAEITLIDNPFTTGKLTLTGVSLTEAESNPDAASAGPAPTEQAG